ncbi:dihydrofolate synthase/folylpolyglutamate synthase [Pseudomonas duriflava]|uniref:Dihydrofolate synthase/folylpolyglutamate synthase n=2 Tax=Pseudomonas duriflava TaxID=459528 RepID=A0A562Q8J9_9PSED|nr:dihydrofolate synthase/folylpolyglutamate synthase [Pseudomonas duriflava]
MSRTLSDWLSYFEQLHPSAIEMGLERSRTVFQSLGLGRLAPRVVTVTGTNGKGSTCAFLAELLSEAGLRVGVYSSPHLLRYNERVVIEGCEVDDDTLCEAFSAVEAARGSVSLTYFEMGTLAAFWLFARARLDAVVLEVGLGGRLDAVNLVDADIALVTSIGLDHAEWLGNTRDSVAFEKAGIFRAERPAICGDLDPPAILSEQARKLGTPLLRRGVEFDLALDQDCWHWRGVSSNGTALTLQNLPLLPLPLENAALALQAFASLNLVWVPEQVIQALGRTRVAGRLDRRQVRVAGKNIHLLLDVGHNPHAASYLARRLKERPLAGRRLAAFGLLSDKDLEGVVAPLVDTFEQWAVAALPTPRSRQPSELADVLQRHGAHVTIRCDMAEALRWLVNLASEDDEIVVFGSFYSVAEAMIWLKGQTQEE